MAGVLSKLLNRGKGAAGGRFKTSSANTTVHLLEMNRKFVLFMQTKVSKLEQNVSMYQARPKQQRNNGPLEDAPDWSDETDTPAADEVAAQSPIVVPTSPPSGVATALGGHHRTVVNPSADDDAAAKEDPRVTDVPAADEVAATQPPPIPASPLKGIAALGGQQAVVNQTNDDAVKEDTGVKREETDIPVADEMVAQSPIVVPASPPSSATATAWGGHHRTVANPTNDGVKEDTEVNLEETGAPSSATVMALGGHHRAVVTPTADADAKKDAEVNLDETESPGGATAMALGGHHRTVVNPADADAKEDDEVSLDETGPSSGTTTALEIEAEEEEEVGPESWEGTLGEKGAKPDFV